MSTSWLISPPAGSLVLVLRGHLAAATTGAA